MELLQDLAARLAVPGLPTWSGLPVLLLLGLAALCLLAMPFSVFGLKGRLESIELELDEMRAEIRALAMRLPDPRHPAAAPAMEEALDLTAPRRSTGRRPEPRLDWPDSAPR